jgi:hypothetical protein
MNEIKLIGLSGQLQNGKDTVADLILKLTGWYDEEVGEHFSSWHTRRFAGILKQMAALLIGCKVEDFEDIEFKNKPLGEDWRRWYFVDTEGAINEERISGYFSSKEEALNNAKENNMFFLGESDLRSEILTPRLILQLLGTEGGRDVIHPNIWVNATLGKIKEDDKVIITDCRFPNEVEGIKKRKGVVVRVVRPSKISTSTHPSETSLNDYKDWDYIIINDGTLEDLERKVREMLVHFNILSEKALYREFC